MQLHDILKAALEAGASDVHLVTGHQPAVRVHTELAFLEMPVLGPEVMKTFLESMAPRGAQERFNQQMDADFSYAAAGLGRYRVNAHMQRGQLAFAMRLIKTKVPALEVLNLPEVIGRLTYLRRGLVLVTGDTGSGKSTTLAAMIEAMSSRYKKHIITLEDPVEYVLSSNRSLLEQRELGLDMPSFSSALRHALRQDPDIILVGEMRDLETTQLAITAAETGHLVLSTLHTSSAAQTVERIIDMYPANQQNQIRAMLANTLQAVVSQTLISRVDKPGMVPAVEVLLCTPAVRNLIREARAFEIPNVIETSRALGMTTLDRSIAELYFN
ncbi:MAG: type IV pilus twitching motility protein PilT, partial [bacterium]